MPETEKKEIVFKIIHGFVSQRFDKETGAPIDQEFIAADEAPTYEDDMGEVIENFNEYGNLRLEMKNPEPIHEIVVNVRGGLVQGVDGVPEKGVSVEIRDYDINDEDINDETKYDEDGEAYWGWFV